VQIILQRRKLFLVTHVAIEEETLRSDLRSDADDYLDHGEADASLSGSQCLFGQRSCIDTAVPVTLLPTKDK
jgi:hypothetical protein